MTTPLLRRLYSSLVLAAFAAAFFMTGMSRAVAFTIEQTISREDPRYDAVSSKVVVGRNGLIYMSHSDDPGYILRMKPDGTDVHGYPMVHAEQVWAVNADGIEMSGLSHFSHTAATYDMDRNQIGTFTDFNNDNYDSPQYVSCGASGDFYALNARVGTIIRLSPACKTIKAYSLPPLPAGRFYTTADVCESKQAFLLSAYGVGMSVRRFDGTAPQTIPQLSGYFTMDDDGTIYFLSNDGKTVTETDLAGKVLKTVKLDFGDRTTDKYPIVDIQLLGSSLLVKRAHPYELYARYDLSTGAYLGSVNTHNEELTATYPDAVWTAGQPESFKIALNGAARTVLPDWDVRIAPLGTALWRNLPVTAGQVTVPESAAGLYHIRVTAGTGTSEYLLNDIIEVHQPGSKGTITTISTQSRIYYARGEAIDAQVFTRCAPAAMPKSVVLSLIGDSGTVSSVTLPGGKDAKYTIPADFTRWLAPGLYRLSASSPGFTSCPQYLVVGPGAAAANPFKLIYYGDYGSPVPAGGVYDAPDLLSDALYSTGRFDINFYVARMTFYFPMGWPNDGTGLGLLASLKDRLTAEPDGVAPEKADLLFPTGEAVGAYGANGGGIMAELVNMDAGLPIGTGFDPRTPEQFAAGITGATKNFASFTAFKGWDWAANWWDDPSKAFTTPDQKSAYAAATKNLAATGAWDPILDTYGDTVIGWQTQAQSQFAKVLNDTDPGLKVSASGPYRRPAVYPPISFSNVDEVDLHYQAEQITTPLWTAHAGAYMKRPGKPAWIHPENYNDGGTGDQVLPAEWDSLIGGVDGAGLSGTIPGWGYQPADWRVAYMGLPTVYRSVLSSLHDYGPWLMSLGHESPIAIPVSRRQVKADAWCPTGGPGGLYFNREWEAYMALLFAHRPADFVFIEDMKPGTLSHYKAIVLVGQTIEIDPELKSALDSAKAAGVPVYADDTCRKALVSNYNQLGIGFDHVEKLGAFNQDPAFLTFPDTLIKDSALLSKLLAGVPPVVGIDEPEVLASLKTGGQGRYVLLVNNTHSALPAEMLYRVNVASSTLMPIRTSVMLPAAGKYVYDITSMRRVTPTASGAFDADLRTTAARLYAILPSPIASIALRTTRSVHSGQSIGYMVAILDPSGTPIPAAMPVHVKIVQGAGVALLDLDTTTGPDGRLTSSFDVPLDQLDGRLRISATDLVSGKIASAEVAVTAAGATDGFHTVGLSPSTLSASTVGESEGSDVKPIADRFGVHLRDLVLADNNKLAVASAMQWGDNVYAIDTQSGQIAWQKRIGQYWAFQPRPSGNGVSAVGFDFQSAAGFHLYQLDQNGVATRRFADYGLPQELPSVFNASLSPNDPTLSFAEAPSGAWAASSGNLGVAVWRSDGTLIWSLDRKGDGKSAVAPLWITDLGDRQMLVADGLKVTAYDVQSGKAAWAHELAQDGKVIGVVTRAGTTFILTSAFGGTVYCIEDGVIKDTLPVSGDQFDVSPDGTLIATASTNSLRLYRRGQGLMWAANSAFFWRFPHISADGRVAASDEGGNLSVYDSSGAMLTRQDLGAVATPAFLSSGDLIAATWNGEVIRLSREYKVMWRTRVEPGASDIRRSLLALDTTPTSRVTSWTNSVPDANSMSAPLGGKSTVSFARDNGALITPTVDASHLVDGTMAAPPDGYFTAQTISPFQWGSTTSAIVFDRGNELVKLNGLTFYEDETDPASWLRDVQVQRWDGANRKWVPVQRLLSDSAIHAHKLTTPVESNKFRVLMPAYGYSSVKLKGIVLAGQSMGPNYPADVRAGKPVVTMFDDNIADLSDAFANGFDTGYEPKSGPEAFSGGQYFVFEPAKNIGGLNLMRPLTDVTNWLFPISVNPQPGQYRYLQLAIKRLSPDLKHVDIYFTHPDANQFVTIDIKPTDDWVVYWLDIGAWWQTQSQSPLTITQMFVKCDNGAAAFDWMLLGRTMADLQKAKPVK